MKVEALMMLFPNLRKIQVYHGMYVCVVSVFAGVHGNARGALNTAGGYNEPIQITREYLDTMLETLAQDPIKSVSIKNVHLDDEELLLEFKQSFEEIHYDMYLKQNLKTQHHLVLGMS